MQLLAKKSLGQHFLNSPHVLRQIIEAANIERGETILEIGPGTGILTKALLDAGAKVIAVEKDSRAFELLKERFIEEIAGSRLELILGDILNENPVSIQGRFALVANIPYYITGAILQKFLEKGPQPTRMVLLVQKEVAERIVARDGKESILSISVKAFGVPTIIAKVPRGAFTPPPTVDSAILAIGSISLERFERCKISPERFFEVVRVGFAHKRKFLTGNLSDIFSLENVKRAWTGLDLNEKIRAEDLKTEQWFDIAAKLSDAL